MKKKRGHKRPLSTYYLASLFYVQSADRLVVLRGLTVIRYLSTDTEHTYLFRNMTRFLVPKRWCKDNMQKLKKQMFCCLFSVLHAFFQVSPRNEDVFSQNTIETYLCINKPTQES